MFTLLVPMFVLQVANIRSEIKVSEDRLLAMGVDVRPLSPENDPKPLYSAIARDVTAGRGSNESIFRSLESAAKMPEVHFIRTQQGDQPIDRLNDGVIAVLDSWCQGHAADWAKKHEWHSLDRLFRFEDRFKLQLFIGGSDIFGRWLPDFGNPPLGYLSIGDDATVSWLKKKLEAYDFRSVLLARLSRFGRVQREFKGMGHAPLHLMGQMELDPPPKSVPTWEAASKSDALFQDKADLATLQQLNVLARKVLRQPTKANLEVSFGETLWQLLDKQKGDASAWAKDHVDVYDFDRFDLWGWYREFEDLNRREHQTIPGK